MTTEPRITMHAQPGMSEEQVARIASERMTFMLRHDRVEPHNRGAVVDRILLAAVGCLGAALLVIGVVMASAYAAVN